MSLNFSMADSVPEAKRLARSSHPIRVLVIQIYAIQRDIIAHTVPSPTPKQQHRSCLKLPSSFIMHQSLSTLPIGTARMDSYPSSFAGKRATHYAHRSVYATATYVRSMDEKITRPLNPGRIITGASRLILTLAMEWWLGCRGKV